MHQSKHCWYWYLQFDVCDTVHITESSVDLLL